MVGLVAEVVGLEKGELGERGAHEIYFDFGPFPR